jgi:trigger factor
MQVSEKNYCEYSVQWTAPLDLVSKHQDQAVERLNKAKVMIKGYRPGKAPKQAFKTFQPKMLENNSQSTLIQEAYDTFTFEQELTPMFGPQISKAEFHPDGFDLEMTVYTKPKFEVTGYTDLKIPEPAMETMESMVEKTIGQLAVKHANLTPYGAEDFVQAGDKVTLSLWTTSDTEEQLLNEMEYQIGSNLLGPDFDNCLYGTKIGETSIFSHQFGKEVWNSDYEDKKVDFRATISMGFKVVPAPIDDSLAKAEGLSNLGELVKVANGVISNQLRIKRKKLIHDQIVKRLNAANEFKVPEYLVKLEAQNLARQSKLILEQLDEKTQEETTKTATEMVKLSLILDGIRNKEIELKFSHKELYGMLAQRLVSAGYTPESMQQMEKRGELTGLIAALQDSITLDWIEKKSEIIQ